MRIKMSLSYDGTNYCGWQIQNNGVAVQQVVADAIEKVTGEKVTVTGSGRTDAGVHAECQVAHFDVKMATVPPKNYAKALKPGGYLCFEFDMGQGDDVCAILEANGYTVLERTKDYNDRERAVIARYDRKEEE